MGARRIHLEGFSRLALELVLAAAAVARWLTRRGSDFIDGREVRRGAGAEVWIDRLDQRTDQDALRSAIEQRARSAAAQLARALERLSSAAGIRGPAARARCVARSRRESLRAEAGDRRCGGLWARDPTARSTEIRAQETWKGWGQRCATGGRRPREQRALRWTKRHRVARRAPGRRRGNRRRRGRRARPRSRHRAWWTACPR
jgi:hypothetical protein